MFVLAAMAVALAVLSLTSAVLPRWLALLAHPLALALQHFRSQSWVDGHGAG